MTPRQRTLTAAAIVLGLLAFWALVFAAAYYGASGGAITVRVRA